MNIKSQLEAEAHRIVDAHRADGGGVHDLIAKCASEKAMNADQVRSLTQLVNRVNFKQAMAVDNKDEIEIADAEAVLHKLRAPVKAASQLYVPSSPGVLTKAASVGSVSFTGGRKPVDIGPTLVAKLAAREKELKSQLGIENAKVREGLFKLAKLGDSVKRAGIEGTETYKQALAAYPEADRALIELVLAKSPTEKVAFTQPQLKMFLGKALEDTRQMAKVASEVNASRARIAEREESMALVREQKQQFKTLEV